MFLVKKFLKAWVDNVISIIFVSESEKITGFYLWYKCLKGYHHGIIVGWTGDLNDQEQLNRWVNPLWVASYHFNKTWLVVFNLISVSKIQSEN